VDVDMNIKDDLDKEKNGKKRKRKINTSTCPASENGHSGADVLFRSLSVPALMNNWGAVRERPTGGPWSRMGSIETHPKCVQWATIYTNLQRGETAEGTLL
jgi:hypothetical protein